MRVIYLVMEWIPGQDLVATLASGPLDLREVRSIGIQVADALDAAHQVGVIHRDLKPANIRLTPDRRVKVLDFGLAKILEDAEMQQGRPPTFRTTVGSLLGTAPYMSPEQLFGRDLDTRSDLFSLGVVLYEMATGELPFQGKNIVLMLQAISRQEPRPPRALRPQASPALERVILKLLAKDPDGRYPSAAAAAEALRATPEPA